MGLPNWAGFLWGVVHGFPYWGEYNTNFIFSFSAAVSCCMYANITQILILIDVQYLQNVICGIEKGLNDQNHFLSDPHQKIHHPTKFPIPPHWVVTGRIPPLYPLMLFAKHCTMSFLMEVVKGKPHRKFFEIYNSGGCKI